MHDQTMRRYWNARAREDPFYFVDTTGSGGMAAERIWGAGDVYCQVLLRRQ